MTIISGIQQVGIGVTDTYKAFEWYRKNLGFDIPVFDDPGTAELMLPYTGGKPQSRHAVLAVNLQGGGGLEIWQYTSRTPRKADFDIKLGDLGIFCIKIKTRDIRKAFSAAKNKGICIINKIEKTPEGINSFYIKDPYGNIIQIVENDVFFTKTKSLTGGVFGAVIGVSDMEKSIGFYKDILEYDRIIYDVNGKFNDLAGVPGAENQYRRVLIEQSRKREGAFGRLLGSSRIELVKSLFREPEKIYKDRFWGDLGYIHLCYDIQGMGALKNICSKKGYPFTVDSNPEIYENGGDAFDMGKAQGHFSYTEDPDGTLVEFVETHRLPILKKPRIYLNLKKRNPKKPLPDIVIKALKFNRTKDVI